MPKIAPVRFVVFAVILVIGIAVAVWLWQPLKGVMAGFDFAALVFLASHFPLLKDQAREMRRQSKENDANRAVLLIIAVASMTVILTAVGAVIQRGGGLQIADIVMVVATLSLAWLFGNVVYALHYAHMYYLKAKNRRGDAAGIVFPETKEPDYWDFLYFSFTLGMTFQTSDCDITSREIRRVSMGHSIAAFIFNLGVLAFTINALGS